VHPGAEKLNERQEDMGIKKAITLLAMIAFSWLLVILIIYGGITLYGEFLG